MSAVDDIRGGKIDINSSQLFFSVMIRSLIADLNNKIKIGKTPVHHRIYNTGDDTMWILNQGQDQSIEPINVSNENNIYNTLPYCSLQMESLDTVPDQLSSPYASGECQFEYDSRLYTLSGEFRRYPVKVNINAKYHLDSFNDCLEMLQNIVSKLAYIQTFKFVYLGQTIMGSYKIPESISHEHMAEIDASTTESKDRIIEISLELESTFPVWAPETIQDLTHIIIDQQVKIKSDNHEIIARGTTAGPGYSKFRKRTDQG